MKIEEYLSPIPHNILDSPRDTSQFHLAGPITFRRGSKMILSGKSKKNPFINFGGNRQNQDSKARQIRMPDKGYKLVNRDLDGADALIVSMLCRQGPYREIFQNGLKPHTYIALHFFPDIWKSKYNPSYIDTALKTQIKYLNSLEFWPHLASFIKGSDYWDPTERYYYYGKKSGLSFNYGMSPQKFIDTVFEETEGLIDIPLQEGARWSHMYHSKLFPEIQSQFQFGVVNYAKRHKCLRNLYGWPFNFHKDVDKFSQKDLNELYAWIPQSTVAATTLIAMVEFQDYIEANNKQWHILNEVHDSILCEAPENEVEECAVVLGECMKKELTSPIDGFKIKCKSSCKIGFNYGDYDKNTNPEGMQEIKI